MRFRFYYVVALLFFAVAPLRAQKPVWVLLRPEVVRQGELVRGIRHREVFDNDRAIPRAVIRKIESTGAKVRYTSRWLQAVSVDADANALAKLNTLPEVRGIRAVGQVYAQSAPAPLRPIATAPSAPLRPIAPAPSSPVGAADFDSAFYGPNWKAIKQLGIAPAHQLGFTGKGIRIALIDTGFQPSHDALVTRFIAAQRDFINRDNNVTNEPADPATGSSLDQERHGTQVWSLLGGFKSGVIVGPAYDARFLLAKVDVNQSQDTAQLAADEDRWVAAVEWADSNAARIINSSLGFRYFVDKPSYTPSDLNGDRTLAAIEADEIARRGILLVTAAGNLGPDPSSLVTPADADSVIAVGAVDSLGNPAFFRNGRSTGRGPTADGRLKPELVALGRNLFAANSVDRVSYDVVEGTSYSTPLIAGVAAMFMQAWPNLTLMAVRNALLLAGSRAEFPDNNVGFGVPNIGAAILFPEGLTGSITGVNLNNELTTIQPTFTWNVPLVNQQMLPVRYRLQIATDPAFNNVVYTDTITNVTSLTLKRPLTPAPAYWWRVIGEAFPGITRSTRNVAPFVMPDWVKLTTLNGPGVTLTDSLRPVFAWDPLLAPPPSGPFTYELQVLNAASGGLVLRLPNLMTATVQPPDPLTANVAYRWRVIARSQVGVADTVESAGSFLITNNQQPPVTLLYQNFPNPFPRTDLGETSTHIWFDVNVPSTVELAVYDLRGRLVRNLIPATSACTSVTLQPGQYGRAGALQDPCVMTSWDGREANGKEVPKGVYILRLRAAGTEQVKKILYLPPQ